jgi:hypothetical protein
MKLLNKSKQSWPIILVFAIGILLRLYVIYNRPIAPDEIWTFLLVKGTLRQIIQGSLADFHPPLYYLGIRALIQIFKSSIYLFRIVSLSMSIFTSLFIYKTARLWVTRKTAIQIGYLSLLSAGMIYDGADGRMFATATCASSILLWSVSEFLQKKKMRYLLISWISFIVGTYVYYFLGFYYFPLLVLTTRDLKYRKQALWFAVSSVLLIVPLLFGLFKTIPVLTSFHSDLSNNPLKILYTFTAPFIPAELYFINLTSQTTAALINSLLVITFIVCFYFVGVGLYKRPALLKLFGWLFVVPCFILVVISILIRPLIGLHSLIIFTPILWLSLAISIQKTNFYFVAALGILALTLYYFGNLPNIRADITPYSTLSNMYTKQAAITVDELYPLLWSKYVIPNANIYALSLSSFNTGIEQAFEYRIAPLDTTAHTIFYLSNRSAFKKNTVANLAAFKKAGYRNTQVLHFSVIDLYIFDK